MEETMHEIDMFERRLEAKTLQVGWLHLTLMHHVRRKIVLSCALSWLLDVVQLASI
jgi:hypothetical protein